MERDPYEVLALPRGAGRKEIERSYWLLTRRKPPLPLCERDLVDWAYLTLCDPARRAEVDRRRGFAVHPALEARPDPGGGRPGVLARRAMEEGRWADALREYGRAVAAAPWDPHLRAGLGMAAARCGDPHRGRRHCLEALRLAPDDAVCRRALATVYEIAGLPLRSRRVLRRGEV